MKNKKEILRAKRHRSIRLNMHGTEARPRLVVRRSLKNMYAQVMDDDKDKVMFSLSTSDKEIRSSSLASMGNIKAAAFFGEAFAKKAKEKGVSKIIFDRAGYLYHGRIKAFADELRKGGLQF